LRTNYAMSLSVQQHPTYRPEFPPNVIDDAVLVL
jgi:hypothetical protein